MTEVKSLFKIKQIRTKDTNALKYVEKCKCKLQHISYGNMR